MLNMLIGQDNPPHPDAQLAKQRNRRGINLSENADGRYRITGWLDHLEGTRLREALDAFTDKPAAGDTRTPQARRADALTDIAAPALANTRPLGISGLSVLVDAEHLPDGIGATRQHDRHLLGPGGFALATCTTIATLTSNRTVLALRPSRSVEAGTSGAAIRHMSRGAAAAAQPSGNSSR